MTTKVPQDLVQVEIATFSIQFLLPVGSDDTFTILQSAPFGFTIDRAYCQTASGTITANIKIGGTSVTGLSAIAITSTESNTASTAANTVAAGDKIEVTTTSNSTGTMVSICIECTKATA